MAMDEDLAHALIHCSHAKQFWVQAQQLLDFSLPKLHPSTWSRDILCDQLFSEKKRAIIVTVMWAIWHSWNHLTHDQEKIDLSTSVNSINEESPILDIPRQDLEVLPGYGWRPPDGTIIKINTDAAIHFDGGNGGAGGVARAASRLLGAQSKTLGGVMNPLIAEAMSVREGVRFANLRGFQEVVIKTDCLEVVELWKNRHNSFAVVAPLFYEIGELATAFSYVDFLHVSGQQTTQLISVPSVLAH